MKTPLITTLLLTLTLLADAAVSLHDITLGWTPSTSPGIGHYTIYELTPVATNLLVAVPGNSVTLSNVDTSVAHTYAATATSAVTGLESVLSVPVTTSVSTNATGTPPTPPGPVFIIGMK